MDPTVLSADEESFFATGQVPASMAGEAAAAAAETARLAAITDNPAPAPHVEPAPTSPAVTSPVVPAPAPAAPVAPPNAPTGDPNEFFTRSLAEERQHRAALQAQLTALQAQLTETARVKAEPPPPDELLDPLGAQLYKLDKMNRQFEELRTEMNNARQQQEQARQLAEFQTRVTAIKTEFTSAHPDFPAAYEHIRTVRSQDLRDAGCPEADIPRILYSDETQLAFNAIQAGKNPAEQIYNMARRYGHAATAAPTPAAAAPTQQAQAAAHIRNLANGQFAARQPERAAINGEATLDSLRDGSTPINDVVLDDKLWNSIVGGRDTHDIFTH